MGASRTSATHAPKSSSTSKATTIPTANTLRSDTKPRTSSKPRFTQQTKQQNGPQISCTSVGLFVCEDCSIVFEPPMEIRAPETIDDACVRYAKLPKEAGWELFLYDEMPGCDIKLYKCYCPKCTGERMALRAAQEESRRRARKVSRIIKVKAPDERPLKIVAHDPDTDHVAFNRAWQSEFEKTSVTVRQRFANSLQRGLSMPVAYKRSGCGAPGNSKFACVSAAR